MAEQVIAIVGLSPTRKAAFVAHNPVCQSYSKNPLWSETCEDQSHNKQLLSIPSDQPSRKPLSMPPVSLHPQDQAFLYTPSDQRISVQKQFLPLFTV